MNDHLSRVASGRHWRLMLLTMLAILPAGLLAVLSATWLGLKVYEWRFPPQAAEITFFWYGFEVPASLFLLAVTSVLTTLCLGCGRGSGSMLRFAVAVLATLPAGLLALALTYWLLTGAYTIVDFALAAAALLMAALSLLATIRLTTRRAH